MPLSLADLRKWWEKKTDATIASVGIDPGARGSSSNFEQQALSEEDAMKKRRSLNTVSCLQVTTCILGEMDVGST